MGGVIDFVSDVAEGIGEVVSDVVDGIGDFISDVGDFLFGGNSCKPSSSISDTHAAKIANELAEMKEETRRKMEPVEEKMLKFVNKELNAFLKELEELNSKSYGGKSLRVNIEGIRKEQEALKSRVKGHIGDVMDQRLVLTDKELSKILEERDDKKRKKNFDKFVKQIKKEALDSLSDEIRDVIKAQSKLVQKEIQARLKEVEEIMKETERAYAEILEAKKNGGADLEQKQVQYMYQGTLYQILQSELEK